MGDWAGFAFLLVLIVGGVLGLRSLARPKKRTTAEFERNAAEGTTALGAGMNALQELLNAEAAKAKEVQMQMVEGRFAKRKREGKSGGTLDD